MSSEDEIRYVKDWERIQKIGLYPEIKTPQIYLSRVAFGAAQAERYIKNKNILVPAIDDLKALHANMFCDVHPWAGSFRKAGQEVRAGDLICTASTDIKEELRNLNQEMLGNDLTGSKKYKAELISYYHASLIAIHPFLDGNGRLSRIITGFQSEKLLGLSIDLSKMERRTYIQSLQRAHKYGDLSKLTKIILDSSQELGIKKPLTEAEELKLREKRLIQERKELGFKGTDVDALYGLGGFPKPITEEEAIKKAAQLKGIKKEEIPQVAALLLKDDAEINKRRKLVQNELLSIREKLTLHSKNKILDKGLGKRRG